MTRPSRASSPARHRRRRRGRALARAHAHGARPRLRRPAARDVRQARDRLVPGGARAAPGALPRSAPAQPLRGRPREVHRLRAVRLGLPGGRDLRAGGGQHRRAALLARRALRRGLPDQLQPLHPVRPVHRGVPDACAHDDQRVRDQRRLARRAHLDQGPAARRAARGHLRHAPHGPRGARAGHQLLRWARRHPAGPQGRRLRARDGREEAARRCGRPRAAAPARPAGHGCDPTRKTED
jgi:hypothetical protein